MSAAIASDLERYMLDLVNEERTSRGLNGLVLDKTLNASADAHSDWMLDQNVFSHTGIGWSTPTERMTDAGFDFSGSWRTAENIATQSERGDPGLFDDVYDLHLALMNSPGHRENILTPELEVVGIGIETGDFTYSSGTYFSVMVTQNFAMTGGETTPDIIEDVNTESDFIRGLGGNDTLMGGLGNDLIDGGQGIDTAVFSGAQASYSLQLSPNGSVVTDRRLLEDGTDQLIDIELLQFADGVFDLDIRSGAVELSAEDLAKIAELYIAYFDRAPAAKGLMYWATRLEDGMTLAEIAESFFEQPEVQGTYRAYLGSDGGLTNTEAFVSVVFNNVLGRDPSGAYWVNELNNNPEIMPAVFVQAVLNGAKSSTGSVADAIYLETKTDIGMYFSAIKGLSNYDDTVSVMEIYDGSSSSVTTAVAEIDRIHSEALDPDAGEFLIELVGVVDDPFASF